MDEFDLELEEMKKTPVKCREVVVIFGNTEYECPMCGAIDKIRPPMNCCCWCGHKFEW